MSKKAKLAAAVFLGCLLAVGPEFGLDALGKKPAPKKDAAAARELAICNSPDFLKAVQFYKKGDYKDAISNFERVESHGGCCQWTQYYLGLSCQGSNQEEMAYRHFEWVISHGKNANLRRYSQFGCDTATYYSANRTYSGQGGIPAPVAGGHGHRHH